MQYHQNGFRPGDPAIADEFDRAGEATDRVDVLIVGCGPAGLTLAAQLSAFPQISVRITERKSGPLQVGQADGIACRSVEMFEAFGFAEKVMKEAYWVNEVAFWRPAPDGRGLARADRIQDVVDDLSEMPHLILNQARVHDFYLELMRKSARRLVPDYARELIGIETTDNPDHPITARFKCLEGEGTTQTIHARYLVGCDGARSTVRRSMGLELKGEAARQLWGVMDVLAVTDFPDIRLKAAIQSADQGSLLIIPREGGYMVRMYIELDELHGEERAADRDVTAEMLIEKAQTILAPYRLDVKEVAWWSAYEIGQRVCDGFDDVPETERGQRMPRIFIAGDACHTHSPKAGQGMNVSMADSFNLGWKLAAVLRGEAKPCLLDSYSGERRAKAKELIDFDRDMARLFSAKPRDAAEAAQFQDYFKTHGRYTAGVETRYAPSLIIGGDSHQALAKGLVIGTRFHSAPVIRLADAKPMQLGHAFKADGRWRLVAFAPSHDDGGPDGAVAGLCSDLMDRSDSPIHRGTRAEGDIDSLFDLRAVFQQPHARMRLEILPELLLPRKGRYQLIDYEKCFCADPRPDADIFQRRGLDRQRGALVVLRPDQYVAQVLPLDGIEELARFFDPILPG
jgi:phenol 2-monooxygenase